MFKKRVGLFGGSFNPIHYGHLFMAQCAKECLRLDKVIFIPTNISPFKCNTNNPAHRAYMIGKAIEHSDFELSVLEITKDGVSYTIDTLRNYSRILPNSELFFIMGSDSFDGLQRWKEYRELFNYKLVVMARYQNNNFYGMNICGSRSVSKINPIRDDITDSFVDDCCKSNIIAILQPLIGISSTQIRAMVKKNILSIRYLTPDSVINYINTNNLYMED